MKTLYLFLLASFTAFGQTSFKEVDIDAASGNQYETLLTNVEYGFNDTNLQSYLQKIGMTAENSSFKDTPEYWQYMFKKQIVSGEEKQGFVTVRMYKKKVSNYDLPMTTKVEIWGDWVKVVEFYCGFWSTAMNFEDVRPDEVTSTRFLTDVATLTFPDSNTAKITVVTAKDR